MNVATQNFLMTLALGVGLAAPWPKRKKTTATNSEVRFSIVEDPTGEDVYAGPGNQLITRFAQNTYLGVLTGDTRGDFVEVATFDQTETRKYFFWVRKARIREVLGKAAISSLLASGAVKEKAEADFQKIITANA